MKKSFYLTLFFVALFFCVSKSFAQTTVTNWKGSNLSFAIPNTHKLKSNTADAFESGDKNTWLEIYPYKDAAENSQAMIQKLVSEEGIKVASEGEYTTGGYEGYWARCEKASHPEWLFWYIGVVDPKTNHNFYAVVWYKKDDQTAQDLASKIAYSLQKM
ncbi:MAG: hypothetical protein EAZ97_11860 [Bacteroidetes bacterium]|nr:MAG: hypothetical protein EAZ97_11860 [Bacteroidota bacterium]